MNNQQFRNLLLSNSQKKDGTATSPPASRPSATPALGSRKRSSIPMTPRQVGGRSVNAEFARQLAERNEKANPNKKRYRSAAPKGTKLAAGYVDRTKSRVDEEEDERAQRIKALEESWKKGEIDRDMFDQMVQEIAGGDYSSTHLVKGLDRKLLEKVRRGEDITADQAKEEDGGLPGVEDEFDELADKEIGPIVHEKTEKKGQMAPPPPVAGVKRTRAQILADLKESRRLAAEAAEAEHRKKYPSLGPGFRKVGPGGETTRIEVDAEGREILIITGPDGKEKRKVRKAKQEEPQILRHDLENPDKPLEVLNAPPPKEPEPKDDDDDDDDIFEGVGSTYNPLADVDDSDDDSSEDEAEEGEETKTLKHAQEALKQAASSSDSDDGDIEDDAPPAPAIATTDKPQTLHQPIDTLAPKPKRTWFNDKPSASSSDAKDSADATVLAALAKVRTLDASSTLLADTPEARLQKRAAELAGKDRDMEDLDMGFGASRFDDAEEMEHEGEKVKFSEWRGLGGDDDEEDGEGGDKGGKKRKRGGKKRKGDKNSAADVLRVMERQKGGS